MFTRLQAKDRHTDCQYCNYTGCVWSIDKYGPKYGHWMWVMDYYWTKAKKYSPKNLYRMLKRRLTALDYSQIDNVEIDGIDHRDSPDYVDAFISYADYKGKPMSDKDLDRLNEDSDYVYPCVIDRIY